MQYGSTSFSHRGQRCLSDVWHVILKLQYLIDRMVCFENTV